MLKVHLFTLPETNIAPENQWLEDAFPFGIAHLQVRTVSFRVGHVFARWSRGPGGPTCGPRRLEENNSEPPIIRFFDGFLVRHHQPNTILLQPKNFTCKPAS